MAKENRMRVAIVVVAGLMLAGCAAPVTVENPRTGQSLVCGDGARDWSPWSQQEACVAGHLAQGWTIVSGTPEWAIVYRCDRLAREPAVVRRSRALRRTLCGA